MVDDFRYLFPSVESQLYSKWEQFYNGMMTEYEDINDVDYIKFIHILKKENLPPGKQIFIFDVCTSKTLHQIFIVYNFLYFISILFNFNLVLKLIPFQYTRRLIR